MRSVRGRRAHYTKDMSHSAASLDMSVAGIAAKVTQGVTNRPG